MTQLSHNLIGQSPAWLATLDTISGLAAIDRPILVVGERGTGKTVIAGRLHFLSKRWEQAWQAVRCDAYTEKDLEAEIFGGTRIEGDSLLERAEGGTLFIDAIDALPLRLQAKILHLCETGEFTPMDTEESITVDIRLIASSVADLPTLADKGAFRQDLLEALSYDVVSLPPLRARESDITLLGEHFAQKMVTALDEDNFPGFSAEVLEFMRTYAWPGNVRQLKTVVERAVGRAWNDEQGLQAPITQIDLDPFEAPWRVRHSTNQMPHDNVSNSLRESPLIDEQATTPVDTLVKIETENPAFTARVEAFELAIVTEALTQTDNHQGNAAKYLGLTYHQFRGLLRKHGLKKYTPPGETSTTLLHTGSRLRKFIAIGFVFALFCGKGTGSVKTTCYKPR